jgi:hypothetical protein
VFAEIVVERSAILDHGRVTSAWGDWGSEAEGIPRFRATRAGEPPLGRLPSDVGGGLADPGDGALGLSAADGPPVVLPARWLTDGGGVYAVLPEETLALAGIGTRPSVALQVDRPSWWRAREMLGAMVRGQGEVAVVRSLSSGRGSASSLAAAVGLEPAGAALIQIRPQRLVWWRGWSSGTVTAA